MPVWRGKPSSCHQDRRQTAQTAAAVCATGMWEGGRRPRERSPIAFIRLNGHRRTTHRTHLSPRDWHRSSRELETIQEERCCVLTAPATQIFRFCGADAPREEAAAVVRCPIWRDTITSRYLCHLRCWTCIPGRSLPLKLRPSLPHILCLRPPPRPPHPLHHPHHTLSMYARIIPAWHAPPECGVFVISHRGADILQAGAHRGQHGLSASSRGTTTTSPNGAGNDILHPFHASPLPRSIWTQNSAHDIHNSRKKSPHPSSHSKIPTLTPLPLFGFCFCRCFCCSSFFFPSPPPSPPPSSPPSPLLLLPNCVVVRA